MADGMMNINNPMNRINAASGINSNSVNEIIKKNQTGASFQTLLDTQLKKNSSLQFSKHAQERVGQRGIEISDTLMQNLENAVSKARSKGSRDVVIIDTAGAFIVNVPNNIVVTTMTGSEMKDNIFTNIDSAMMI